MAHIPKINPTPVKTTPITIDSLRLYTSATIPVGISNIKHATSKVVPTSISWSGFKCTVSMWYTIITVATSEKHIAVIAENNK